jgi:hypothetical protein
MSAEDANPSTLDPTFPPKLTSPVDRESPKLPLGPKPPLAEDDVTPVGTPHTPLLTPPPEEPLQIRSQEPCIPKDIFLQIQDFYQGETSGKASLELDGVTDDMLKELDDMEKDGRLSCGGIRLVQPL